MQSLNKEQARHQTYLFRLLTEVLDNKKLANNIFFKGGTCARMLGYLDRFSVDLDFDLKENSDKTILSKELNIIFQKLDLQVKDKSEKALQFFLKYPSLSKQRNTIKLELLDKIYQSNQYEPKLLKPINRTAVCQTIETIFSHKLIDIYEQRNSIAGRDIYDIHYFFIQGYNYDKKVIKERRGVSVLKHLQDLKVFIENKITQKVLEEDLNVLLDYEKFKKINKYLKQETINFLETEIKNLSN